MLFPSLIIVQSLSIKKEYGFLVAAASISGGLFIIFSDIDNHVVFGGAMSSMGIFIALLAAKRRKEKRKTLRPTNYLNAKYS